MKRTVAVAIVGLATFALVASDGFGRGGFRGGGGGFRGGGGYSRPAGGYTRPSHPVSRTPSMSRPSTPSRSRPSTSRPSTRPTTRPAAGQRPATRPQGGAGGSRRPAGGAGAAQRPSHSQLQQFLNLPGQGGAGRPATDAVTRPGVAGGNRPAGGNAAVADFLNSPSAQARNAGSVAGNRADNISNRTDARSDFRDQRGERRDFASDNRQERVQDRGDRQAARVSNRGEFRSDLATGRGDRRSDRQQRRGEYADQIRDHLDEHYDHDHLFDDFWANHPHAHYHFHQNPVFWTWATVGTVRAFMPWNWPAAGGGGGEVYYDDGTVYTGDEQVPADEYAAQAEQIVESAPEVEEPDDMEWLPLGVFALTQDNDPNAVPNMFLQLAVSKEGILAGTYQNKTTGQTESVEGMVDQQSKRAAWTISGKSTPILETPVVGLTENETNVLVHFANGQTQQWLMLHVENPDVASQTQ